MDIMDSNAVPASAPIGSPSTCETGPELSRTDKELEISTTCISALSVNKPITRKKRSQSITRRTTSKTLPCGQHTSHVFVRVRPPLLEAGISTDVTIPLCEGLVTDSNLPNTNADVGVKSSDGFVNAMNGPLPIGGFHGVFGMEEKNSGVFHHAFLPRISTVMKGGTSSLFCYGYTGAGKTHTTLGYNDEKGLFQLTGEELLRRIKDANDAKKRKDEDVEESDEKKEGQKDDEEEEYILLVSAVEVYNDKVFDLLGQRASCTLRKNARGQLLVRGATRKHIFTEQEAKENGVEYSIVTETLSAVRVTSSEDLKKVQEMALQYRAVGTSTEHSESSRSHAIFRWDIVNQTLLSAMDDLEAAESIKPAVQTAYDKNRTYILRHKVLDLEKQIKDTSKFIDDMYAKEAKKKLPLGGRLILVDLAGADSDKRIVGECGHTLEQRKESAAINQSLLSLKECIRALAGPQTSSSQVPKRTARSNVPFRNSSLTRFLEEVLTPAPYRESNSVMIVNIGPEADLSKKTVNSLRYGEMFSSNGRTRKVGVGSRSSGARRSSSKSRSSARMSLMETKRKMKEEMKRQETSEEFEPN